MIGTTVSHYEILERLGSGGMGVVYKARDLTLDRLVALKFLSAHRGSESDRRRFLREARAASSLDHPNICTVYEVGEAGDGRLFIAMSLCEGAPLKEALERGPLPPDEAVRLAAGLAAGLAAAHAKGIIHRDIKPGNVMVAPGGTPGSKVKLVDFGIAKLAEETRLTRAGTVVGTASYIAPELFRGEAADHRSDVWALGVLLYEMLTGNLPFDADHQHELIEAILRREPEPPSILASGVPHELDRVVLRALAKRPADRYPDMEALREALERLLQSPEELGRTVVAIPSSRSWPITPSGRPPIPPSAPASASSRSGPWAEGRRDSRSLSSQAEQRYEILEPVGGGGMGIVYKARDTRLGRIVALKFLPPELTRDPEAKERFLQEARAASALDHPNVCTIHEIGEDEEERLFLAMAYYDGETLKRRLEHGPLPLDEAADLAKQVAQGLTKAHRQGIVHRDVKPANLILTTDGVVKILDFGIAKLAGSSGLTQAGSSLGTPAYMSPEQARGEEVDGRTDVWSLGAVLYEMLAGRRPFPGDHDQAVIYALLHETPKPLPALRVDVPPDLAAIVSRMLEKDPKRRYPSMADVLADLRAFRNEPGTGTVQRAAARSAGPASRRRLPWLVAGLALAAATAGLYLALTPEGERVGQANFERLTEQEGRELFPALAPDGQSFAYVKAGGGNLDIYLQSVGGDNALRITDSLADDTQPAFSPAGQQIAFRSEREGGGIFVMGNLGGSSRRVTPIGYNPSWSPDGKELVVATEGVTGPLARSGRSELWRIDVASGERRRVTRGDAVQPSWSPGGHRIAYWSVSSKSAERIVWTVPAAGGEPKRVTNDTFLNWSPVWSPDGRYLYYSSDRSGTPNIWRVPIDEASGEVRGQPEAVNAPSESSSFMSFSADGRRMVYATDDGRSNLEKIGFDPGKLAVEGELSAITEGSRSIFAGEASPDGRWIAYQVTQPRDDLFVIQPDGSGLRQLTDDDAKDRLPRWSPDGSRILFYSNRSGRYDAWTIRPDGSGLERLTVDTDEPLYNPLWSPDGRRLVFSLEFKGTALLDLADIRRRPRPLALPRDAGIFNATSWSPDGKLLAGELATPGIAVYSLESGSLERLTDSGSSPVWLAGGRALLYLDRGRIFAFDLQARKSREVLAPRSNSTFSSVSPGPDGRTLYVVRATTEGDIWQRKD